MGLQGFPVKERKKWRGKAGVEERRVGGGGEISALQIPGLGLGFVLMSVCMCKGGRFWEWEDLGRNWGE